VGALLLAGCLAAGLAGCGSSNLLGPGSEPTSITPTQAQTQQPAPAAVAPKTRVAVAPIMGAPDNVGRDVGTKLGTALERQSITLAKAGDTADYTLRGYMVATKERAGTKVSYIFDLTDPAGKRVNRIQGEETAPGGDAKNPWAVLTPELSQRITDKAASSLSGALASLGPPAGNTGSAPPVGVGGPTGGAIASAPSAPAATTGSIQRTAAAPATPSGATAGGTLALVPAVVGAPGDGNTSLSAAMRQELSQAGVGSAGPGQRAYSVAGRVTVGAVKDGKQPIKIDWRVTDPGGGLLATVSQNNEIQAGALDGTWGTIASEAAQGAAPKIRTLIEEHKVGAAGGATRAAAAARPRG
jgi:hypothetical protein